MRQRYVDFISSNIFDADVLQQPEEQVTCDYLLRIFRASIPYLPKTAAKFGQELQLALQPMIIKPSATAGILVSVEMNQHCGAGDLTMQYRACKRQLHVCVL